jgi:excisionase family DNA binding protein
MQTQNNEHPRLISVFEAGRLLGISKHTVRAWGYQGRLQSIKMGRRVLIPYSEIERVVNEGVREVA